MNTRRNEALATEKSTSILSLRDIWLPAKSYDVSKDRKDSCSPETTTENHAQKVFNQSQALNVMMDKAEVIVETKLKGTDELREETDLFIKNENKRSRQRVAKVEKSKNKEIAAVKALLTVQTTLPAHLASKEQQKAAVKPKKAKKSLLISVTNDFSTSDVVVETQAMPTAPNKPSVFDRLTRKNKSVWSSDQPIIIQRDDCVAPAADRFEESAQKKTMPKETPNLIEKQAVENTSKTVQDKVATEDTVNTSEEKADTTPLASHISKEKISNERRSDRTTVEQSTSRRVKSPPTIDKRIYQRCMDHKYVRSYARKTNESTSERRSTRRTPSPRQSQRRHYSGSRRVSTPSQKRNHSRQRSPQRARMHEPRAKTYRKGDRIPIRYGSISSERELVRKRSPSVRRQRSNSVHRVEDEHYNSDKEETCRKRKTSESPIPRRARQERGRSRVRKTAGTPTNSWRKRNEETLALRPVPQARKRSRQESGSNSKQEIDKHEPSHKRKKFRRDISTSSSSSSETNGSRSPSNTSRSSSNTTPDRKEGEANEDAVSKPPAEKTFGTTAPEEYNSKEDHVEPEKEEESPQAAQTKKERVVIRFSEEAKKKFAAQPQGVVRRFQPYPKPKYVPTEQQQEQTLIAMISADIFVTSATGKVPATIDEAYAQEINWDKYNELTPANQKLFMGNRQRAIMNLKAKEEAERQAQADNVEMEDVGEEQAGSEAEETELETDEVMSEDD